MAQPTLTFESGHEELIHDAQLDYYGKRLATASSDRTIKIFDVSGPQQQLLATLKGHDGPVWQVSWGHPKYGSLLASCAYDRKVIIWKEEENGQWVKLFDTIVHESSVNSIAFAPHSFGLLLASASADGNICVLSYRHENNTWERQVFRAHNGGVNAVSWAPAVNSGALLDPNVQASKPVRRFVSGGCDNRVRIWRQNEQDGKWVEENCFVNNQNSHSDWVRDVAWAPSLGLPSSTIASCSEDKTVTFWTEDGKGAWQSTQTLQFDHKVWRLSWSVMGNILAVSTGDNKVSLWKEALDGTWKNLSSMSEADQEQVQH